MNLKELILKYHSKDGGRAILENAGTEKYTSEDGPSFFSFPLNLSALKGEDSQATLRITTLGLAPEGSHRPHASGF
jgi:hypothetical protein